MFSKEQHVSCMISTRQDRSVQEIYWKYLRCCDITAKCVWLTLKNFTNVMIQWNSRLSKVWSCVTLRRRRTNCWKSGFFSFLLRCNHKLLLYFFVYRKMSKTIFVEHCFLYSFVCVQFDSITFVQGSSSSSFSETPREMFWKRHVMWQDRVNRWNFVVPIAWCWVAARCLNCLLIFFQMVSRGSEHLLPRQQAEAGAEQPQRSEAEVVLQLRRDADDGTAAEPVSPVDWWRHQPAHTTSGEWEHGRKITAPRFCVWFS